MNTRLTLTVGEVDRATQRLQISSAGSTVVKVEIPALSAG
jgi:hypothetical protein